MEKRRSVASLLDGTPALHGPEDWARIDVIGEGHVVETYVLSNQRGETGLPTLMLCSFSSTGVAGIAYEDAWGSGKLQLQALYAKKASYNND